MKNKIQKLLIFSLAILFVCMGYVGTKNISCYAIDSAKKYFTIYADSTKEKILFLKGDEVIAGDRYLSHDNKLYEIECVDEKNKTAIAKFIKDEELPKLNVKAKQDSDMASAKVNKSIGVYHTHNDECYYTPDGIDSIYGKGGIHDVGKSFVSNLEKLGIKTVYREDLHLPHNSGAYTRSQVTASALLDNGVHGIFDLHRDSTKRSEYLTKVNGEQMSSIRMVVGSSSKNYEENKKFAYLIKSYADEVYPGLIKDIYFGKGNYNQGLTTKAMLFEMGCENIEKALVLKSTPYLAKVVDAVLYGTENASETTLADVEIQSSQNNNNSETNVASEVNVSSNNQVNSNHTLYVVLGVVGFVLLLFAIIMIFSKKARYKVGRFFSETFAGIFGKKKKID